MILHYKTKTHTVTLQEKRCMEPYGICNGTCRGILTRQISFEEGDVKWDVWRRQVIREFKQNEQAVN